jgi:MFS family permease
MAAVAEDVAPRAGGLGAAVVPLLALAVFINYVDRGNLATAAPLIKDELHLTSTQIGLLLSAFFWSYMPGQILAGWLAEKIIAPWPWAWRSGPWPRRPPAWSAGSRR